MNVSRNHLDAELKASELSYVACVPVSRVERQFMLRSTKGENSLLCSPYPGQFVRKCWWSALTRTEQTQVVIRTLALVHPDWVFCSLSAAVISGICDSYFLQDETVHILTTDASRRRSGIHVKTHYSSAEEYRDVLFIRGACVTSFARTVFDCARSLPFPDALGIVDAALRTGRVEKEQLLQYCQSHMNYRNALRAMVFISYGDGLSENGGESYARAQMIRLGFQSPQLQVNFFDPIKKKFSRVDYFWREGQKGPTVFEFHGKQKYTDPMMTKGRSVDQLESAEEKRAHRLSLHGVQVDDIDFDDARNLAKLRHELVTYGIPRRPRSRPGFVEFNRKVECPRGGFPPPVRT